MSADKNSPKRRGRRRRITGREGTNAKIRKGFQKNCDNDMYKDELND